MSTDTRPAWAPTGQFPQRVRLRNGWTATINGTNAIGFLVGRIRDSGPDCKWHKNGWCTLRTFSTDQRQFDIVAPAGEEQDIAEIEEELERLRAENTRLKLLAAPEPPPGEWQKTHRVVAVRKSVLGDTVICGDCVPYTYTRYSGSSPLLEYILEPLEPPKPEFVCPPHLAGKGYSLQSQALSWGNAQIVMRAGRLSSWAVGCNGLPTVTGIAMGFTSLPDLQPGQEMEL